MHTYVRLYAALYRYIYLCTAMYIWPYKGVLSSTKLYIHTCVRLRISVYGFVYLCMAMCKPVSGYNYVAEYNYVYLCMAMYTCVGLCISV